MENKKWDYAPVIEKMTDEQLKQRIQDAMDFEIENQIRRIPYLGGKEIAVEFSYPELIARCPMTGIRDLYKVRLKFIPGEFTAELKSLKLYFWGYETLPISHEHVIAKIFQDFSLMIQPEKLAIQLLVAERGEFVTTIETGDKELLKFSRSEKAETFGR